MGEKMITITKDKYKDLMEDSWFLRCLVSAGVDNWEGYELAINMYQEMEDE